MNDAVEVLSTHPVGDCVMGTDFLTQTVFVAGTTDYTESDRFVKYSMSESPSL